MKLRKNKKRTSSFRKTVAIVVPVYKKELSTTEAISMNHLLCFLTRYDKYFVAPKGLKINYPEFKIKRFSKKHFKSIRSYSRLLLTKKFYQQFDDYKYILIYQLDSLVFSDQLLYWCDQNYDYIGAPWFKSQMKKGVIQEYTTPYRCGNGGLSLRNINSFIKVIENAKKPLLIVIKELMRSEMSLLQRREMRLRKYLGTIKRAWRNLSARQYPHNEDGFWSFEAPKYYSDFKIPPVKIGLKFSFEVRPRYCFKKNNYKLPFGCHAWMKYDKRFWLPYLLKKIKNIKLSQ